MNWQNLKEMTCPQCNSKLVDNKRYGYSCSDGACGYGISYDRFRSLVNSMYEDSKPKVYQPLYNNEDDSLSALNNL